MLPVGVKKGRYTYRPTAGATTTHSQPTAMLCGAYATTTTMTCLIRRSQAQHAESRLHTKDIIHGTQTPDQRHATMQQATLSKREAILTPTHHRRRQQNWVAPSINFTTAAWHMRCPCNCSNTTHGPDIDSATQPPSRHAVCYPSSSRGTAERFHSKTKATPATMLSQGPNPLARSSPALQADSAATPRAAVASLLLSKNCMPAVTVLAQGCMLPQNCQRHT